MNAGGMNGVFLAPKPIYIQLMMNKITFLCFFFLCLTLFSGCELIAGIFEAGVWTGVALVALIVVLVIYLITKLIRR